MAGKRQTATSLTEQEIGIAKTLLGRRDFNNQKVLAAINAKRAKEGKPPINGGRISQIKHNHPSYSNVTKSSDKEADDFLDFANSNSIHVVRPDESPVNREVLKHMLPVSSKSPLKVKITETDRIECKKSFGIKNCLRAIPAFANNKGGYLIFGIEDATWEVKGINKEKFDSYDWKELGARLKADLSSEVNFHPTSYEIEGICVGVLYIHPARMKPLMFLRNNSDAKVSEGDILYRYGAENRKIACMELQAILDERVRNMSELALQKHLATILRNGPENSAVLNIQTGEIEGKSGKFLISEELLPKIQFIKEGEFVEKSGSPTLKLIGSLQSVDGAHVVQREVNITNDRIMQAFLSPKTITDPNALIQYQLDLDTFLPIFRFIQLAVSTPNEVAENFKKMSTSKKKRRQKQIDRILDKKPPQAMISKENNQALFDKLLSKNILVSTLQKDEARRILMLMTRLDKEQIEFDYLSELLTDIWNKFSSDTGIKEALRWALRYLDYILFKHQS